MPPSMLRSGPSAAVTLIRPPILQIPVSFSSYGAIPPIGLAYVAAVLRDAGHRLTVIDGPGEALDSFRRFAGPTGTLQLQGLTPEEIVDRVPNDTEVVGITHMFLHEWPTIRRMAESIKARLPHAHIVVGGENATAFWPWIFKETDAVDYCVLGEGEATMLELVARLKLQESTAGLAGVVARKGVDSAPAGLPARITQVAEIPWPAWEFINLEAYLAATDQHGVHRGRSIPMLATRGCPYQCTFCSSPQMWTTKYVTRTPQDVVTEMKAYVERYGVNNVNFCDLTTIIRREWTIEFCKLLIDENLGISWQLPSGTRSEALDAEVLRLLYQAGCRNLTYAPESGSERMLNVIKKRVKLPRMLESLKAAEREGLRTSVNIIIGHPQERRRDTWQSFKFLLKAALAGSHSSSVMVFAPYPGSADFKALADAGRIELTDEYYYVAISRGGRSAKTYNPSIGKRELFVTQMTMLIAFHALAYLLRPWRIVALVRGLVTGAEESLVQQTLRTKLRQLKNARRNVANAGANR
jgi:radical SAM superfamily enzyme YgiQ (UPF0313 family)